MLFKWFKNILGAEQPLKEEFHILDPNAVKEEVKAVTLTLIPPSEDMQTWDISLYWSNSQQKLFEKKFEDAIEADELFEAMKTDLQEVATLTKEQKMDAAKSAFTNMLEKYAIYSDKLVEGDPQPITTTMADLEPVKVKNFGEWFQANVYNYENRDVSDLVEDALQEGFSEQEVMDHLKSVFHVANAESKMIKEAGITMQNIFFDSPEEAKEYQQKMLELQPEPTPTLDLGEVPTEDGEELVPMEEEIGPPSLSYEDAEKQKAEEEKNLSKRIEHEVQEQVESALDKKIATMFTERDRSLVKALRGVGRTWEEVRDYMLKELKYDKEGVAAYLDQMKKDELGIEEPEEKMEAPKPPEELVSPETHDKLLEELPEEPEVEEIARMEGEIAKQAGKIKTRMEGLYKKDKQSLKEIVHQYYKVVDTSDADKGTLVSMILRTEFGKSYYEKMEKEDAEVKKQALDPLEAPPILNPDLDFQQQELPGETSTFEPVNMGEPEVQESFAPGDHVYVMSDYETKEQGYEGTFISEFEYQGDKMFNVESLDGEMYEVPKYLVTKAELKKGLKKVAEDEVKKCPECEKPNQFGELCQKCLRDEQERAYEQSDLDLESIKNELAEITKQADLLETDDEMFMCEQCGEVLPNSQKAMGMTENIGPICRQCIIGKTADPVEVAPEVQTTPIEFKPMQKAPPGMRERVPAPAPEEVLNLYKSIDIVKQNLNIIDTTKQQILAKAQQEISQMEESMGKSKLLADFNTSLEKLAMAAKATGQEVLDVGDQLLSFQEEAKKGTVTLSAAQWLEKIKEKFPAVISYIEKASNGLQSLAKTVTHRKLFLFPKQKLSSKDVEAEPIDMLKDVYTNLVNAFSVLTDITQ